MSQNEDNNFKSPPWKTNAEGQTRKVGVELEAAGITSGQMADAVIGVLGGECDRESPFINHVRATELGDFRIELDADLLKSRGYQKHLADLGIDIGEGDRRETIESVLSKIAGLVVPLELVGPPVPWTELRRLDEIRRRLHEIGAQGTHSSPLYAFGMQLNIEAASLKVDHLLTMMRAFMLGYDELIEQEQVDLSRRISPYVQPYPEDYVVHLLQPDYAPDITALIDDFLEMTPTRNRPLDLLPLFAHIDEDRVMAAPVERDLVKPRPAWHYRLPNCLIDEPDWSLATVWNRWIEIERLAADPERLEQARSDRLANSGRVRRWVFALMRRLRR